MARRPRDGGNTFMDFAWGVIILAGLMIFLLKLV